MNQKAQTKMIETIAVLFIFFVLIMFGIIFYAKYSQIATKEKQEELLAARAMEITLKTLFLPELTCSKGEAVAEDNCFDILKLKTANKTFSRYIEKYYYDLFLFSDISVQEIYPGNETFHLYHREKPNWESKESTFFVIALKDIRGVEPKYGLGSLKVEVYS